MEELISFDLQEHEEYPTKSSTIIAKTFFKSLLKFASIYNFTLSLKLFKGI